MPQWLTKPEVIFSTALTVVLFLGSLYGGEIRRSFGLPRKAMVKSLLKFSENELRQIELMHGNAYYLLLWIVRSAFDMLNLMFWIAMAAMIVNVGAFVIVGHLLWMSWRITLVGPFAGMILGRGRRDYGTIKALYDYENTVARLRKNIELCKKELGLPE